MAKERRKHFGIKDKAGTWFPVYFETDRRTYLRLFVTDRKWPIGKVDCYLVDSTLQLNDICIFDAVLRPRPWWDLMIRTLVRCPAKPIDYRRRGLGSALLELTIQTAIALKMSQVTGWVMSQDVPTSVLINWYQSHGFEVEIARTPPKLYLDVATVKNGAFQ